VPPPRGYKNNPQLGPRHLFTNEPPPRKKKKGEKNLLTRFLTEKGLPLEGPTQGKIRAEKKQGWPHGEVKHIKGNTLKKHSFFQSSQQSIHGKDQLRIG